MSMERLSRLVLLPELELESRSVIPWLNSHPDLRDIYPGSPKLPPVVMTKSKSALWYERRFRFTRGCNFSFCRIYSQARRA